MIDKLKSLWARITIRWHVLVAAFLAALPEILNYLGFIDLQPILEHLGIPDGTTGFIVSALPFLLMFLKNVVHMDPVAEDTE